jgi:hypothetical protein
MTDHPSAFAAARHATTALLNGAAPTDVVLGPSTYGDWVAVITNLVDLYTDGGTPAVVRGFHALARADRNVAALIIPSPTSPTSSLSADMPSLPEAAVLDPALATTASPWLDAYIAYSRRWSPRSFDDFHESIGVWLLSVVAARRVVAHLGKPNYTPLCIALAGRSTIHAKTTAAEIGVEVLHVAGLDWLLADDDSTPQKFIHALTQHVPEEYPSLSAEQQAGIRRRLAFAGQCGWWYDEFGMLLHGMARSGSTMSDFSGLLRKFDDCAPLYSHSTISRKTDRVINPYVALLASLTPTDLRPLMQRGAAGWSNGFWARWAFVTPPTDEVCTERFPEGTRATPPQLVLALRAWHERLGVPDVQIVDTMAQIAPLPVQVCTLGTHVVEAFYAYNTALLQLMSAMPTQELDSCYARLSIKALRVAMLLGSLENNGHIELCHWARGQAIAERWRASLHRLYAQTNGGDVTNAATAEECVLGVIERLGQPSVRDIKTRIAWLSRGEIQDIVEKLVKIGQVDAIPAGRTIRYQSSPDEAN